VEPAAHPAAPSSLKADAVLLALTATWGLTFIVVKGALDQADPFTFLALRFSLGALAACLVAGRRLLDGPSVRAGLVLAPFLFLGFVLQTVGLRYTTASRSAFLTGLAVVLVPFGQVLVLRAWPKVTSLVGVAFSVVGTWFLSGGFRAAGQAPTFKGDVLTVGCAIAYAAHITLTGRFAARVKVTAMVAVQLVGVAALALACVPFGEQRLVVSPALLGGLAFTGLFASALALNVQSWGQARTTPVRAALIFSMEPVFAAGYAVLFAHEHLSQGEWGGGGLIVVGILVAEVGAAVLERLRSGFSAARPP